MEKESFNIEFPEGMNQEEIKWIKEYIFRFLERHSCKVEKK